MSNTEKNLECALTELNEIIDKMDKADISLEESFKLYHEGVKLVQLCNEKIEKVEKEITILNEGNLSF